MALDPHKLHAIQTWSMSSSVKALRGFLGLTRFYRKFVKNYVVIASPLTTLLKRESGHRRHIQPLTL